MLLLGKCTLALTVILVTTFTTNCDSTAHIKSFQKDIDLSNEEWTYFYYGFSDNSYDLFYSSCVNTSSTAGVYKVSSVAPPVQENQAFYQKTCIFSNPNPSRADFLNNLLPVDHENVLFEKYQQNQSLYYYESTMYLIRMSNCRNVQLFLPNTVLRWKQVLKSRKNNDTFDLFYKTLILKKTLKSEIDCENNICRVTYNMDGEVVGGPTVFVRVPHARLTEYWFPLPSPDLVDSNSIYFRRELLDSDRGFYRVRQDGTTNELFNEYLDENSYTKAFISNSKISLYQNWYNGSAMFRQFDSKNNDKQLLYVHFNKTDYSDKVPIIEAYNPREDGLVLAIIESVDPTRTSKLVNLKFVRIRPDGQRSPAVVFPYEKSNFTNSNWNYKFIEDDTQICFKMMSHQHLLTYSVECISKSYFYQL